MVKCQSGDDYDIFFDEKSLNLKALLEGLKLLAFEEENSYMMFVFSGIFFKTSNYYLKLLELFPQEKNFNFECFTNETLIVIKYIAINIKEIIKIISENDKSYEHFFYFNEKETILEYCDVFCEGQMSISKIIPKTNVESFSKYLELYYKI
jgi:hypothetical protein